MPTKGIDVGNYRLFSPKWGDANRPSSSFPFKNEWQRLRAIAKAMKLSREARKRIEWFEWTETKSCGNIRATCRHFGIAPKVYYFWKKRFVVNALETLEDRSHRPNHVRQSTLTSEQVDRIVGLRTRYLRYSKIKLAILYQEMYGEKISSWKIQSVIRRHSLYPNPVRAENTAKKRRRSWRKRRITDLVTKPESGFLFCLDTVVRHFNGSKRYILTAVDRHSRLAFARMYTTHTSAAAADFLQRLHKIMGGNLLHIQTDNGSEFKLHFEQAVGDLNLMHWWSRTKTPKDNAVCERFNRTLQEEFIAWGNMYPDPEIFNEKLTEWLIEYDFHRPHMALGYRRPIEIASLGKALPINPSHTFPCAPATFALLCQQCSF